MYMIFQYSFRTGYESSKVMTPSDCCNENETVNIHYIYIYKPGQMSAPVNLVGLTSSQTAQCLAVRAFACLRMRKDHWLNWVAEGAACILMLD